MEPQNLPTSPIKPPTIFVVDDDPKILRLLESLLTSEGFAVQTYASAGDFLDNFTIVGPACLLLDLQMPGLSGGDLQREMLARKIEIPIIFLTATADVQTTVELMKRGASDLIQKPFKREELLAVVRATILRDSLASLDREQRVALQQRYDRLTPREREVMESVVSGNANKQVAILLQISEKTVELHRARVMQKMQADSLPELVRQGMVLGIAAPRMSNL